MAEPDRITCMWIPLLSGSLGSCLITELALGHIASPSCRLPQSSNDAETDLTPEAGSGLASLSGSNQAPDNADDSCATSKALAPKAGGRLWEAPRERVGKTPEVGLQKPGPRSGHNRGRLYLAWPQLLGEASVSRPGPEVAGSRRAGHWGPEPSLGQTRPWPLPLGVSALLHSRTE